MKKYKKRLIEVAIPLEAINAASAREQRYVRGALSRRELSLEHKAIQFDVKNLLERVGTPA
jgi:hypothetical protein